jgi:hypothetical protein
MSLACTCATSRIASNPFVCSLCYAYDSQFLLCNTCFCPSFSQATSQKCHSAAQIALTHNLVSKRWLTRDKENQIPPQAGPPHVTSHVNAKTHSQVQIQTLQINIAAKQTLVESLQAKMSQQQSDVNNLHMLLNHSHATLELANCQIDNNEYKLQSMKTSFNEINRNFKTAHGLTIKYWKHIQQQQREKQKMFQIIQNLKKQGVLHAEDIWKAIATPMNELAIATKKSEHLSSALDSASQEIAGCCTKMQTLCVKVKRLQVKVLQADKSHKLAKNCYQQLLRASKKSATWLITSAGTYTPQAWALARTLCKAGCSQDQVGSVIVSVGQAMGIKVSWKMSQCIVQRANCEAGIAACIQMAYELANA